MRTEELSLAKASADLGINRQSLHTWVKTLGTGKRSRVAVQKQQAQAISEAERIRGTPQPQPTTKPTP